MSDDRRHMRLLIAGLVFAIVANVIVVWMVLDHSLGQTTTIPPVGNVTAIIICAGAIWLVRWRMRNPRDGDE